MDLPCTGPGDGSEVSTQRTLTPTPSKMVPELVANLGTTMRTSASCSTLHSGDGERSTGVCTGTLSPPAMQQFHDSRKSLGTLGKVRPRNFSSRHVPSIAEEIAMSDVLSPSRANRLDGLMKHLKRNSAFEDSQKQVLLVEAAEMLVPEEYDEVVRSEYERRCQLGERMNTEFMSSAKWVRLLRDIGVLLPGSGSARVAASSRPTRRAGILKAEADIFFSKVLHNCDRGGQRLTYELFCKALHLVSQAIMPDLQGEAAFYDIISRIVAVVPQDSPVGRSGSDPMLDARMLMVLEHFKPTLHAFFVAFCGRNLGNPACASPGSGVRRARERSSIKHTLGTQETLISPTLTQSSALQTASCFEVVSTPTGSPRMSRSGSSPRFLYSPKKGDSPWESAARGLNDVFGESGAGGSGSASWISPSPPSATNQSYVAHVGQSPTKSFNQSVMSYAGRSSATCQGTTNGHVVIQNRCENMSADQFLDWCKELKLIPQVLSRAEVVRTFKLAQTTGFSGSHGNGVYGYLSKEAFGDAVAQLGLTAYSKEPFCDEYPEDHEKVCAFLSDYLPANTRQARDWFLYKGKTRR